MRQRDGLEGRGNCLSVEGAGLDIILPPLEPWLERSLCNTQRVTLLLSTAATLKAIFHFGQTFSPLLGKHTVSLGTHEQLTLAALIHSVVLSVACNQ